MALSLGNWPELAAKTQHRDLSLFRDDFTF